MKKLMIMLASIAVAVVAQAATMDWQVKYSYQPGADTDEGPFTEGWVIAVFDAGVAETANAVAITSLINEDATVALTKAADYGFADDEGGRLGTNVSFVGDAGDTLSAYLVIFNSDDAATATKFYISDVATAMALDKGMVGKFKFGEDLDLLDSADADNWTTITSSGGGTGGGEVPEPTSGLLLMLGVVGLALRRKVK